MRFAFLFIILFAGQVAQAQTAPPVPAGNIPTNSKSIFTITGGTSFLIGDLPNGMADFTSTESTSTITINVKSDTRYRVYVAGEILRTLESTESIIPINTFSVNATNQGGGPATAFQLAGNSNYQLLVQSINKTTGQGVNHVLTINRNEISTFKQAPGSGLHILYLHFLLCLY